jgi:hypothetical protein
MTKLTNDTLLSFTEIKNGSATGKTFENTATDYINAVRAEDCDSEIDREFERLREKHFDETSKANYTTFEELPVEEQLALCIERNNDRYASRTTYEATC